MRSILGFASLTLLAGAAGLGWSQGWSLERVETGSMSPVVPTGSVALVKPVDPREVAPADVIVFRHPSDRRVRVLHRVVEVIDQGSNRFFVTKGDANDFPDSTYVPGSDLQGRLVWNLPRGGAALDLMTPPTGFVTLVGLPLAVSITREIRRRRAVASGRFAPGSPRKEDEYVHLGYL